MFAVKNVSFFGLRTRVTKMSPLRYLKPANGLPDPRGSLSTVISPDVISEMNEEGEEATRCPASGETFRGRWPAVRV